MENGIQRIEFMILGNEMYSLDVDVIGDDLEIIAAFAIDDTGHEERILHRELAELNNIYGGHGGAVWQKLKEDD